MKDASLPFGGGSRSQSNLIAIVISYQLTNSAAVCIGMHLARIELRLATALFFREFPSARPSQKEGMSENDMVMKTFFLMAPQGHRCLIEA